MQDQEADLKELKSSILRRLTELSSYIADSNDISYELLIALAQDTGDMNLLRKAFQKIEQIEDNHDKVTGLVDLLDAVELRVNSSLSGQEEQGGDQQNNEG